jgi:hypothetical protein
MQLPQLARRFAPMGESARAERADEKAYMERQSGWERLLTHPRYEARRMGAAPGEMAPAYGVFDTITQTWCVGEGYPSMARAAVAASRMNGAYERAMEP